MTTAILSDQRYAAHTDPAHVERAERLQAINRALDVSGLRSYLIAIAPRVATEAELSAVHSNQLLANLKRIAQAGGGQIDPDTYVTAGSWEAATWGAGAVVRAVEAVVHGEVDNAFALVRPPGHHATPNRSMGFCLVNNISVAARYATQTLGLERVAIIDYDVHHGNGTQDIFYDDGRVLFCSTHAAMIFPGTGTIKEQGSGAGVGTTLNIPLPHRVGDVGYNRLFTEIVLPAVRRFRPQLIMVSAGYDAHWSDPLGTEALSVGGYAHLTKLIADLADEICDGRLVLSLEGGYNLDALGACVVAACEVLLGRDLSPDRIGAITAREPDIEPIIAIIKQQHVLLRNT